jgi:hypothetical protein
MTFLAGQSGNPLGRPKKYDLRTKFIEDWVASNQDKIEYALNILFKEVQKAKPWAIKEFLSHTIAKPKMSIETTSTEISEKRLLVMNAIGHLSDEAKRNLYDVLTQKTPAPVNTEAEVIEGS